MRRAGVAHERAPTHAQPRVKCEFEGVFDGACSARAGWYLRSRARTGPRGSANPTSARPARAAAASKDFEPVTSKAKRFSNAPVRSARAFAPAMGRPRCCQRTTTPPARVLVSSRARETGASIPRAIFPTRARKSRSGFRPSVRPRQSFAANASSLAFAVRSAACASATVRARFRAVTLRCSPT